MDEDTRRGGTPEPPAEPDNLVDDGLGPGAADRRPAADRPHGGIRDTGHADFFDVGHRDLRDPRDPLDQPERRQVVDDYESQVHGAGARTQATLGGTDPAGQAPATAGRPDAEPGAT